MDERCLTFVSQNIPLHYTDCGEGPPIVLLHGFGACLYSWRHVITPLAARHRVLALDLKGFGRSAKPADRQYSMGDQATHVLNFLSCLKLRPVTLVGHSLGGGVALFATLRDYPEAGRIRRLVLLDCACYPDLLPFFLSLLRLPVINRLIIALVPIPWAVRLILNRVFVDRRRLPPDLAAIYSSYLSLPGARQVILHTARQLIPPHAARLTAHYRRLPLPTLIIWGEQDHVIPLSHGQRLARDLPDARLAVIPGCGHAPQEECPELTLPLIHAFLADPPLTCA